MTVRLLRCGRFFSWPEASGSSSVQKFSVKKLLSDFVNVNWLPLADCLIGNEPKCLQRLVAADLVSDVLAAPRRQCRLQLTYAGLNSDEKILVDAIAITVGQKVRGE